VKDTAQNEWTVIFDSTTALIQAGTRDGDFVAPVSGWYEKTDGQWRLIEERPVPACPTLKGRSADADQS
jgi:hypothetical protein